ncbi:MAG TPA: winged helix-turn-helix domain-containing protein, partial [Burkholderiaceae bacterium]|nr:winged helix-turn-helix domain-containing protein [Burkholderiaceae bacterium]
MANSAAPSVQLVASNPASLGSMRFDRFELQPRERQLLVSGKPAALSARAFDVLVALAERAGHLVTKNDLMDIVWHGRVVEEGNLHVHISSLRKMLGVDVIATVPGRGYRFIARVEAVQEGNGRQPVAAEVETATVSEVPKLRTNLPAALAPLISRDDDLALLRRLIDEHRLVTVVGAGGIGKTLLAQHLLAGRVGHYAHGVCWVELASVTDPAAVPGTIAAALGVRTAGDDEPLGALGKALAPLEILLALDNAEHLLGGVAALVQALLDAAPGLRIVATSQASLKVRGEHLYRLGPLAVPERTETGAQALTHGAVALFVERAQAVDPRF